MNCKEFLFLSVSVTRVGSVEQSKAYFRKRGTTDTVGCKYFEDIPVDVRHIFI